MKMTLGTVFTLLLMTSMAMAFSSGPLPGYAGNNGVYCTACHSSFELNSGDGGLELSALTEYTPGETYSIQVSLSDPGQQRWGFQITAVDVTGGFAGTFVITDAVNTQLNAGTYVNHTTAGTNNGDPSGNSWSFDWTAPAAGSGDVTFYLAGNAANGNFNNQGDYIYSHELVAGEAAPELYGLTTTPIVDEVPAEGGNISYSIDFFTNIPQAYNNVNYWTSATLPDNTNSGVLFNTTTNVPAFADVHIPMMVQNIPSFAPAGVYTHHAMMGFFPNAVLMDSFEFFKDGGGSSDSVPVDNWDASGEWPTLASEGEIAVDVPSEFNLSAAYPNPFNAMTNVSVTLPEASDLSLRVINVLGEEVATLNSGMVSAGSHTFSFDAADLSSGIYFVHATVPGAVSQVQRVTLLK
jgi:Secretion system C-terminal sorting domain